MSDPAASLKAAMSFFAQTRATGSTFWKTDDRWAYAAWHNGECEIGFAPSKNDAKRHADQALASLSGPRLTIAR